MRRAVLLACVLALAGCGGSDEAARPPAKSPAPTLPAELLRLYDYDASARFDEEEVKSEEKDGATVHDISYAGPNGRITAFYIVPAGDGPFPAVLFMPGAPGARFTFFSEAVQLAQRGIASLLPDPPYARPPIEDVVKFTPSDKDGIVQEVIEMRRGIDFLVSKDEIDPSRLGYVGFSWGASLGGILSAVERRVHSFVLQSLVPRLSTDMRKLAEEQDVGGDLTAYEKAMEPIDAVNYLPHSAPSAVFLQAGERDTRPSPEDTQGAYAATSDPKKLQMYDTEHELNADARADARAWLLEQLGVS
jgi:cephalosporin-C deacetylase-like acetyl esterase